MSTNLPSHSKVHQYKYKIITELLVTSIQSFTFIFGPHMLKKADYIYT